MATLVKTGLRKKSASVSEPTKAYASLNKQIRKMRTPTKDYVDLNKQIAGRIPTVKTQPIATPFPITGTPAKPRVKPQPVDAVKPYPLPTRTPSTPIATPLPTRNQRMNKEVAGRVKKMPVAVRPLVKPKKIKPATRKVANDISKQAKDMANMFKPK